MASTEVERHTGVDVEDVPSAEWGWSVGSPRVWHITGLLIAGFLLAMLVGNHVGHVEDYTLIAFALLVIAFVVRDMWMRRRGWTR